MAWYTRNPFRTRPLPGPEQPRLPQPADALLSLPSAGGHPLSRLLPDLPLDPGFLRAGPNHRVGAQPERAEAVMAGHSVTGAYLLGGHGLPTAPVLSPRLTPSPELGFTHHPVRRHVGPLLGDLESSPVVATGFSA